MIIKTTRREMREIRHKRLRKKVKGDGARPRLAVFRSSKHIYAQIIDDTQHRTLVAASSVEADLKGGEAKGSTVAAATAVGARVAQKAAEKGIKQVVYDRGGFAYMGRVAALAKAARDNGLEF